MNEPPVISIHAPLIGCNQDAKGARVNVKEVIFCEDCKYRGWLYGIEIAFCARDGGYVNKDDFCSRGKKCEGKGEGAEKALKESWSNC